MCDFLNNLNANIICLQDTHLTHQDENDLKNLTNCECIINGPRSNSCGVVILLKNTAQKDCAGNYLVVDLRIATILVRLINIYAPNKDTPAFFQNLQQLIENNEEDYFLDCGDFNLTLNPDLDSYNYININDPKSRQSILETISSHNLQDLFRLFHPKVRRYTWRHKNPIKQARLDYFLASHSLTYLITSCKINPGYGSDHSMVELNMILNPFHRGMDYGSSTATYFINRTILTWFTHLLKKLRKLMHFLCTLMILLRKKVL